MEQIFNPFIVKGYVSEEYFCDRGKRLLTLLKGLRTKITMDSFSGVPQVEFSFTTSEERAYSLRQLLEFINAQKSGWLSPSMSFSRLRSSPRRM